MSYLKRKGLNLFRNTNIIISESKLENSQWIKIVDESFKIIYSFLPDKRLIVTSNGDGIEKQWEFIVDNDNLLIRDNNLIVYNCHIVNDEFLILNKDNTQEFELFANLTKYKNKSNLEIQNSFTELFESVANNKELPVLNKLIIIQIYELNSVLKIGQNKNKAKRILNNLVYDYDSGKLFHQYFKDIFNTSIVEVFSKSSFNLNDKFEISDTLIKYGVLKMKK